MSVTVKYMNVAEVTRKIHEFLITFLSKSRKNENFIKNQIKIAAIPDPPGGDPRPLGRG